MAMEMESTPPNVAVVIQEDSMTIREVMDRIAGEEYEWEGVDRNLLNMGDAEVVMAVLTGSDNDGRPFMFRLPVETLRKR